MAAFVGVDWGTTRLRAALVAADGTVIAETASDEGMMTARQSGFSPALARARAALGSHAKGLPVLTSGMVGARQGWVEAPYVPTPASLQSLSEGIIAVPGEDGVSIVPGVCHNASVPFGADVMRGEETEVFGALALTGGADGLFVLPGTHAKWVTVEDGAITRFSTCLTGDAFAALSRHTILSATMGEPRDEAAFAAGIKLARQHTGGGALLHDLFALRAEWLFGRLSDDGVASALSGLLIGAECLEETQMHDDDVHLVGSGPLQDAYATALESLGHRARRVPSAAMRGLAAIHAARR